MMSASPAKAVVDAAIAWLTHFDTTGVGLEDLDLQAQRLVAATRAIGDAHADEGPVVDAAITWLADFDSSGLVVADLDQASRQLVAATRHYLAVSG